MKEEQPFVVRYIFGSGMLVALDFLFLALKRSFLVLELFLWLAKSLFAVMATSV